MHSLCSFLMQCLSTLSNAETTSWCIQRLGTYPVKNMPKPPYTVNMSISLTPLSPSLKINLLHAEAAASTQSGCCSSKSKSNLGGMPAWGTLRKGSFHSKGGNPPCNMQIFHYAHSTEVCKKLSCHCLLQCVAICEMPHSAHCQQLVIAWQSIRPGASHYARRHIRALTGASQLECLVAGSESTLGFAFCKSHAIAGAHGKECT